MHLEDPQFPPLLKGHAVKAPTRPFAHACRLAKSRQLGAGDVVWSRNTARAELAIVLEPEVPLERALQMAPLMMVALGDCIGSLSPPKVAIHYRWPNGILLNGSMAGEVRLGAPNVAAGAIPDWLVVGAELEIASPREERQDWSRTSLSEEAGPEITRTDVLRSARRAFPDLAQHLAGRGLPPRSRPVAVPGRGAGGTGGDRARAGKHRGPGARPRRERQPAAEDRFGRSA